VHGPAFSRFLAVLVFRPNSVPFRGVSERGSSRLPRVLWQVAHAILFLFSCYYVFLQMWESVHLQTPELPETFNADSAHCVAMRLGSEPAGRNRLFKLFRGRIMINLSEFFADEDDGRFWPEEVCLWLNS